MENLIGVVGTLAGVFLGGIISFLTSSRQRKHEKQIVLDKRRIEKFEKAHETLTEISFSYRKLYTSDMSSFLGMKNPDNQGLGRLPFEELEMLFSFYIPSLEPKAQELIELCQEYGAFTIRLFRDPMEKDADALKDELSERYDAIINRIQHIKSELAKIIQTEHL